MNFNLGSFGNQLKLDEMNGALSNAGGGFQFSSPGPAEAQGGIQEPAAPTAQPLPPPAWERDDAKQKQGGIGSIMGLVGSFMGGTYGAALQGLGGMMGGGGKR